MKKDCKITNAIGIRSHKLYEISCNTGIRHYISLILREYKNRRPIYIVKIIFTYKNNDKHVYKKAYDHKEQALDALQTLIYYHTLGNIKFQISLPF